ncbi:hypothetical protein [Ammoniphilus sp. CFH 90114]|uniref:hypothetical protein n=1 Tax=Ammoniphilus sp. CFH 90114 TaxID=2493665 RepID=UPI00100E72E1|nr:hypothetical protein [Ammoniphilus sp. CFH 90114]RXT08118.1 hypothetical protein EIZ39_11980 [Ammoniphilus sp. CFH 90114]
MRSRTRVAHREGFKQGMWTALLIASPFIAAGAKWMFENADPMVNRIRQVKGSDLYTQLFNQEAHQEKEANRKLSKIRSGEGNYGDFDIEASDEDDEALFHMIKEITKRELSKRSE